MFRLDGLETHCSMLLLLMCMRSLIVLIFCLISWVSNGVVGSPAFAAFDQGTSCLLSGSNLFDFCIDKIGCDLSTPFLFCYHLLGIQDNK